MIKVEQKKIASKPFFYLIEQINIGGRFKKIQVYLGKNIPKDLSAAYKKLQEKEVNLFLKQTKGISKLSNNVTQA